MKTALIRMAAVAMLAGVSIEIATAKGGCGHVVVVAHGHSSPYRSMERLRDSSFTGYAVMDRKGDTLSGTFTRFTLSDVRVQAEDGASEKRISYRNIKSLHLLGAGGMLVLTTLPEHSGYYRLIADNDSLALYDQKLQYHYALADVDTSGVMFRYKSFTRPLQSDFSRGLRKRLVPIINAHYSAGIDRYTSCAAVYRIMTAGQ